MKPRKARTVLDLIHVLLAEVQADPSLGSLHVVAPDGKGVMLPIQVQTIEGGGRSFLTLIGRK